MTVFFVSAKLDKKNASKIETKSDSQVTMSWNDINAFFYNLSNETFISSDQGGTRKKVSGVHNYCHDFFYLFLFYFLLKEN